jgi:hypothetical protein
MYFGRSERENRVRLTSLGPQVGALETTQPYRVTWSRPAFSEVQPSFSFCQASRPFSKSRNRSSIEA